MSESKTHTIRASEDTIERFKALCGEFKNADEAVQALVNAYALAEAKNVLAGQETCVNDFQSHVDSLVRAYISALDLTANTENRIRGEFRERLESKDKTIMSLQDQLAEAKKTAEAATLTVQEIEQRVADQERDATDQAAALIEKAESAEKERQQAERTAQAAEAARAAMQETLDTLRGQLEVAKTEAAKSKTLEEKLIKAENNNARVASELEATKAAAELAAEKAETEREKVIYVERTKAAEQLQAAATESKSLYAKITELGETISQLKETINRLTEENRKLSSDQQ